MTREKKQSIMKFIKINAIIVIYLVMLLLVFVYSEPEIQPFVYTRF